MTIAQATLSRMKESMSTRSAAWPAARVALARPEA
jgi:hypothetical protein